MWSFVFHSCNIVLSNEHGARRCNYTKRFFKTRTVNHFDDDILLLYTILLLCGAMMTVWTSHLRLTPCPLLLSFYLSHYITPILFFSLSSLRLYLAFKRALMSDPIELTVLNRLVFVFLHAVS
ncbi:hypothetical protein BJX65DRAFT_273254 [Aspergillus insuetus]